MLKNNKIMTLVAGLRSDVVAHYARGTPGSPMQIAPTDLLQLLDAIEDQQSALGSGDGFAATECLPSAIQDDGK